MAISPIQSVRVAPAAKRPLVAQAAQAAPAPALDGKARGPVKQAGRIGGAAAGAVGGFGLSATAMLFGGLAKWGMEAAPGWFKFVAWGGIAVGTALGAVGGAKLLGGLGEKIENWSKSR